MFQSIDDQLVNKVCLLQHFLQEHPDNEAAIAELERLYRVLQTEELAA